MPPELQNLDIESDFRDQILGILGWPRKPIGQFPNSKT